MSERRSRGSNSSNRTKTEILAIGAAVVLVVVLGAGAWAAVELVSGLTEQAKEASYLSMVEARFDALMARAGEAENEHRAYVASPDAGRLKAFNEAVVAVRSEFDGILKQTPNDPGLQADLLAAKAQTEKKLESIRDAIDYQRIGQSAHAIALVGQGAMPGTIREAIEPLQKRFHAAAADSRGKPQEMVSFAGYWLLATWLLAAAVGIGISLLAIRQAGAVGRLRRRLRRDSINDSLTGLPNSIYLEQWVAKSISRAIRTGNKVGLVYVDVINFKQVNHALGYSEGDRVLVELAQKLTAMTRSSDFVARVRNDSFAVVMSDITGLQQLESAMSRFGALSVMRAGMPIRTTVGAALFPQDAETPENLIRLSRAAMYRNRQTRRAA